MKKLVKLVVFTLVSALLTIIGCNDENPITPEDTSYNAPYEDSILFRSERSGGVLISYIDGSGLRSLCDTLLSFGASWSPNKRKVLFVGASLGDIEKENIYIIDLNTYRVSWIAQNETDNIICATYSPDMKYIAYSVNKYQMGYKIKLINLLNHEITELSEWMQQEISSLSWSPDSKEILFDNGYVINLDTKEIRVLFTFNGYTSTILLPNWSPDGSKVAFSGIRPDGKSNIHIYNLKNEETKILYEQDFQQYKASWSRDGEQLIFDQRTPGSNGSSYLCKINIDGSNFVEITQGYFNDFDPCWYK